jgi:hypothetical protein
MLTDGAGGCLLNGFLGAVGEHTEIFASRSKVRQNGGRGDPDSFSECFDSPFQTGVRCHTPGWKSVQGHARDRDHVREDLAASFGAGGMEPRPDGGRSPSCGARPSGVAWRRPTGAEPTSRRRSRPTVTTPNPRRRIPWEPCGRRVGRQAREMWSKLIPP